MQYNGKCNICVNLWQRFPTSSERFPLEQTKCGKLLLDATHFFKLFISFAFTDSYLFLFAFIDQMVLFCTPVYYLESCEYFRRVFVEVLCHSFMRFAKVTFFSMKLYKNIYLHGRFIIELIK